MSTKRIISGIKPSGNLTLGNYLGAMKRWVELQDQGEAYYFVADLHALNDRPKPEDLASQTLDTLAWLLAVGIDPEKSVLFVESQAPAVTQLQTILNNYVTMGELGRMTQFKDKSRKQGDEGQVAGLFEYPVLMAADVLLYDIDVVPVGDDQRQHVELARDIATRFNNLYGHTFVVPEVQIQQAAARVMNLQDPTRKMSKSDADNGGCIYLLDNPEVIATKIKRAVTDSGSVVEASADKPAIVNLIEIYAALTNITVPEVEKRFAGQGYGHFKETLASAVVAVLEDLQNKFYVFRNDEVALQQIMQQGSEKVTALGEKKIKEVQRSIGLVA